MYSHNSKKLVFPFLCDCQIPRRSSSHQLLSLLNQPHVLGFGFNVVELHGTFLFH